MAYLTNMVSDATSGQATQEVDIDSLECPTNLSAEQWQQITSTLNTLMCSPANPTRLQDPSIAGKSPSGSGEEEGGHAPTSAELIASCEKIPVFKPGFPGMGGQPSSSYTCTMLRPAGGASDVAFNFGNAAESADATLPAVQGLAPVAPETCGKGKNMKPVAVG